MAFFRFGWLVSRGDTKEPTSNRCGTKKTPRVVLEFDSKCLVGPIEKRRVRTSTLDVTAHLDAAPASLGADCAVGVRLFGTGKGWKKKQWQTKKPVENKRVTQKKGVASPSACAGGRQMVADELPVPTNNISFIGFPFVHVDENGWPSTDGAALTTDVLQKRKEGSKSNVDLVGKERNIKRSRVQVTVRCIRLKDEPRHLYVRITLHSILFFENSHSTSNHSIDDFPRPHFVIRSHQS